MATHPPGPLPRTAPTMIQTTRDINSVPAARVIVDMDDSIHFLEPDAAPLTTFTAALRKRRQVTQPRFDILSKDPYPRELVVQGAQVAGDTAIEVATGTGSRAGANYLYRNRATGEVILVPAAPAADTLTVIRAIGSVGAAMSDGDTLEFIGIAAEDGVGLGSTKSISEVNDFNFTQIFRTAYGSTGRQQQTDMYGGRDPMSERRWQAIEHKKTIERALFWGRRHTRTGAGGHPQTMTAGLDSLVTTNRWDLQGQEPTQRALTEFLEYAMKFGDGGHMNGAGEKLAFCSRRWLTVIEGFGKEKIQYEFMGDKKTGIGLKVGAYITTHGKINLIPVNIFDGEHAGYMFIVDPNHVRYAFLQGRNTKLLDNRQAPDVDGTLEEYLTDCGLHLEVEPSHAVISGLPTN